MDLFKDDGRSTSIGDLTVENSSSCVSLYGAVDLTRDKRGLANARALAELANAAVAELESVQALGDLPDVLPNSPPVVRKGPLFPR